MSSKGLYDQQRNGVHFFKVILETNLQDGELKVPRSFTRKHWLGISNPVSLRLPNRTSWKVYWMKRDGDVWLRNGWKEFAKYLSLDVAQFVVFRYGGNSSFNVIVFGKNSLETKYPSSNEEGEEEVDESDCSLKIFDHGSPLEVKRPKALSPSSQTSKKIKTNPKEAHASFANAKHINSDPEGLSQRPLSKNDFELHIKPPPWYYTILPIGYVRNHNLAQNGKFATLQVGKRSWTVKLLYYEYNSNARFSLGWSVFVRDCNLEEGDTCFFKMIDEENLGFEVTISRRNRPLNASSR